MPVSHDVAIVGGGLIGLAAAGALAERGVSVLVLSTRRPGEASSAAAGMLAPSIERAAGPAHDFAVASRDRYPAYLTWIRERTGAVVALNRDGVIQVAVNERGVRGLTRGAPPTATWLDRRELVAAEPALAHALGGVFHPHDGAVDNVALHRALAAFVESHRRVEVRSEKVVAVRLDGHAHVRCASRTTYSAARLVIAAGAWSARITGLPRPVPVAPVRGQMLSYAASPVRRVVYGPTGYVVPRPDGRTLVGATMERVGFRVANTRAGLERLKRTATEICPAFSGLPTLAAWAGLRPVSADLQPILGVDPDAPELVYATGHSRNGVLMTPLTAECVAALVTGDPPPADLTAFRPDRFDTKTQPSNSF